MVRCAHAFGCIVYVSGDTGAVPCGLFVYHCSIVITAMPFPKVFSLDVLLYICLSCLLSVVTSIYVDVVDVTLCVNHEAGCHVIHVICQDLDVLLYHCKHAALVSHIADG